MNGLKKIHVEAAVLAVVPQNSASSSSGAGKWDCIKELDPDFKYQTGLSSLQQIL